MNEDGFNRNIGVLCAAATVFVLVLLYAAWHLAALTPKLLSII